MGYPRFNNVEKLEGSGMTFEAYLKQIRLLFPNLPEMYEKYLKMIYEFDAEQLQRLLLLNETELADALFSSILDGMQKVKNADYGLFKMFIEDYGLQDRVKELFDIVDEEGMTFEEYLIAINLMYPDMPDEYVAYLQMIYDFDSEQLAKLLLVGENFLADAIFSAMLDALWAVKITQVGLFNTFVEDYDLQNRAIELFDINVGVELEPSIYFTEFGVCELAPVMYFDFDSEEGYDDVMSITTGLVGDTGYSSAITLIAAVEEEYGRYVRVKVMANWDDLEDIPPLSVCIQAICFREVV